MLLPSTLFLLQFIFVTAQTLPPSCDSPIYCYGDLLRTVQLSRIFNDSKTFVDLKMIYTQTQTLENFTIFNNSTGGNPNQGQVRWFVYQHFQDGKELVEYKLADFNPTPSFISEVTNATVKNFSLSLVQIWRQLARKVREEVATNPEHYSFIYVPNGFIIPGGRFREYYYWDSYWIIDGLLISEMPETARGMIDNFISLVEQFGFIPNGGRIYYLKRSQPPLLTPMAHLYYQYSKNNSWLGKNINTLAKELNYWDDQSVEVKYAGKTYTLFHYNMESAGPRPESYREDINTAAYYPEESQQEEVYQELKNGAASGWDFSSRWIFDNHGDNAGNLSQIQTRRVIPVDLNAFLCGAYRDLSELYSALNQQPESTKWRIKYAQIQTALQAVLWNAKDGIWYDYDYKLNKHRRYFYASNLAPLWSRCFDKNLNFGKHVLKYLQRKRVLDYLGGIPTSDEMSGEQWDFPNAWPPLQDIVVRGLANSDYKPAQDEAKVLARRWINANLIGYEETEEMFEKYDAVVPGQYGAGGEYQVQSGFGWTNGVALRFIYDYYRK